jgi:rhodanese-related sulfurtransferase
MKTSRFTIIRALVVAALITTMFTATQAIAADQIPGIKPEELKKLIESKSPDILVVDNQPQSAYDLGHIPGAVNFPWQAEIEGAVNLPRNKTLVIYCACSHEEDATDTAEQLTGRYGYRNVKLLEGGWIEWMKLGYPVEK